MKTLLLLFFIVSAHAQTTQTVQLDMETLVKKVSSENYQVYQSALRVYQAKESITVARMNLLPRLNLWRLASSAVEVFTGGPAGGAGGTLSIIEDVAPFLVPANWFRVNQMRYLYQADKEGYRALWGNELMTAKALYFHLQLDQNLRERIRQSREDLEGVLKIVRLREIFGGLPAGASQDIQVRLLSLDEDARALDALISEEEGLLAFMLGMPAGTRIEAKAVKLPDFDSLQKLRYSDYEKRAVEVSPENKQYDHIIAAAAYVRQEIRYSFLGISGLSRGAGGGVFDSIPIQSGLGFGTAASLRISRLHRDSMRSQQKGVQETIKRNLKLLVDNYNLDIDNYYGIKQRVELTKQVLEHLVQRAQLGDSIEPLQLIEASRGKIDADVALYGVMFRFLNNEDKLARVLFTGDYAKGPSNGI